MFTCGCTAGNFYWSATTPVGTFPNIAWGAIFDDGAVGATIKSNPFYVRAVRGGS
jgi:hypothetical protein